MFYDVNKTLTYNAFINMIIGARGYGKTYGLKKKAINDFIKKGSQFIYLRRYEAELDLVKDNLFNDIIINGDNQGQNIEFQKDCYFIGDKLAGYAMALSRSNYYKSASFPAVNLIIFDEFIIDTTQNLRYLKNEVRKFLDFIETIFRMREGGKVFLLANSLSFVNPYTIYWNLKLPKGKKVAKAVDGLVLCQIVGDDEFIKAKQETVFGKLNAGTEYEKYSVQNQFILDTDTFICKKSKFAKYFFTFIYKETSFGVWTDYQNGLYYVSEDVDPSCKIVYTTTMQDHQPNAMLLKRSNKGIFGKLIDAYKLGIVRFENQRVKTVVSEVISFTL